jgi:ubiquinone biosynthesis protein UbiJ
MPKKPDDDRASRVHESFDELQQKVGHRLDDAGREAIDRVRSAAAAGDAAALRAHLDELKERHGWLYNELAAHPRIANLLDELALLGF